MRFSFSLLVLMAAGLVLEHAYAKSDGKTYVTARTGVSWVAQDGLEATNPRLAGVTGQNDADTHVPFAVAVGRKLDEGPVRVELEYCDRHKSQYRADTIGVDPTSGTGFSGINNIEVWSTSFMLNAFYEVTGHRVNPFVQIGVGWFINKAQATQVYQLPQYTGPFLAGTTWAETSRFDCAWSVGGGASAPIGHHVDIDLGYRWVALGKYTLGPDLVFGDEVFSANLNAHEIYVGARYGF